MFLAPLPLSLCDLMRLSCRSSVPTFALQAAHLQATANRCQYQYLPSRHPTPRLLMLVVQEAALPSSSRAMSLARQTPLHTWFLGKTEQNVPWLVPVAGALWWSSPRLLPSGNGTVPNDQPLVYDQLLRWHTQGNCLCSQTDRNRLCAMALIALVEIQAPMEVEGLPHVVAPQELLNPNSTAIVFQCIWCQFAAVCFIQQAAISSFAWWQPFDCSGFHHSIGSANKYCIRSIHRSQVLSLLKIVNPKGPDVG